MATVRVTARRNTTYVRAGQTATIERTARVDALIAAGILVDLDPPAPPKKRRARQKTRTVKLTEGQDSPDTAPSSDDSAPAGTGHPEGDE
jgi:hypothetical protein